MVVSLKYSIFDLLHIVLYYKEWIRSHGTTTVYTACHISNVYSYPKAITMKDLVEINTKKNGKTDTYSKPPKSPP
jgi:hypothetical protein